MAVGNRRPMQAGEREGVVREQDVVGVGRDPASRPGLSVNAVVGAGERNLGMGKHEQLEVVVAERQLLEARERVLERPRLIDAAQRECGHAAQRHLRDHAERPERDASRAKCVGVELLGAAQRAAIGEDQRQLGHLGRDVAQARAGAVRGGGDRAGDRLGVDVAEVLQRQSVAGQQAVQLTDRDAGLDAHEPGGVIDVEDALEAVQP